MTPYFHCLWKYGLTLGLLMQLVLEILVQWSIRPLICRQVIRFSTSAPFMAQIIYIYYYNEYNWRYQPHYNIFYDAGDFVKKFATEAEYKQWKEVLDRVVTDKVFSPKWTTNKTWSTFYSAFEMTEEKYHGVSMFVPQDPNLGYYARYNENIKLLEWYWATKWN